MYSLGSAAALSTKLSERISFSANANANYGSAVNFAQPTGAGFDPGSLGSGSSYATLNLLNVNTAAGAGMSAALSQRSTISAGVSTTRTIYFEGQTPDYYSIGSNVRFTQRVFKRLSFYVGYRRDQTFYADLDSRATQGLDFGVDYGDALQLKLSRRTTLSLTIGAGAAKSLSGTTQFRVLGSATLAHSMGRTWTTSVSYARTLEFEPEFLAPVLRDTANAMLGGQLKPRLSFTTSASYSNGNIGFESGRSTTDYNANAVLSAALSRRISLFAQYLYYGYRIPPNASTLPLLSNYARQSAVVGLSLFAPLYSNPRVRP